MSAFDGHDEYTANDAAADAAMDRDWQEDHAFDDPDLARPDYDDFDEDEPEDEG